MRRLHGGGRHDVASKSRTARCTILRGPWSATTSASARPLRSARVLVRSGPGSGPAGLGTVDRSLWVNDGCRWARERRAGRGRGRGPGPARAGQRRQRPRMARAASEGSDEGGADMRTSEVFDSERSRAPPSHGSGGKRSRTMWENRRAACALGPRRACGRSTRRRDRCWTAAGTPCVAPKASCRIPRSTSARPSGRGRRRFAQPQEPERHEERVHLRGPRLGAANGHKLAQEASLYVCCGEIPVM